MGHEGHVVFLIGACVERTGINAAVKAHTGFKEGIGPFNAVADEGGEFLSAPFVWDGEKVPWCMREVFEAALKIPFPSRTWMDMWLGGPVFFVLVQAFGPVCEGGVDRVEDRRVRGRRDVSPVEQ
jgi:hypothetical protein